MSKLFPNKTSKKVTAIIVLIVCGILMIPAYTNEHLIVLVIIGEFFLWDACWLVDLTEHKMI
jgi:hypothetical protein